MQIKKLILNSTIQEAGFVTQDKYLRGRTLWEIEKILGFHRGRCEKGLYIARVIQLPSPHQFELKGYTLIPDHQQKDGYPGASASGAAPDFDQAKLKRMAYDLWTTQGPPQLIKAIPAIPHSANLDDDFQYPSGWGVPQWKLTSRVNMEVIAFINRYPNGRYMPLS